MRISTIIVALSTYTLALVLSSGKVTYDEEYVYIPEISTKYSFLFGDYEVIGRLDNKGNVIFDFSTPPFFWGEKNGMQAAHNPGHLRLKDGFTPGQLVFEFRGGRLIPCALDADLDFIPDLDGKIIKFEDYKYDPKGKLIYNLPGKFVLVQKKPPGRTGNQKK